MGLAVMIIQSFPWVNQAGEVDSDVPFQKWPGIKLQPSPPVFLMPSEENYHA